MKWLLTLLFSTCLLYPHAQNLSGKWYGTLTQGPGGYTTEYNLELNITQIGDKLSGTSHAYYNEEVVAGLYFEGYIKNGFQVYLFEKKAIEKNTPGGWEICLKSYTLNYSREGSVHSLNGKWKGKSLYSQRDCVPGKIFLNKYMPVTQYDYTILTRVATTNDTSSTIDYSQFKNREINTLEGIVVGDSNLVIELMDYEYTDDDMVSVYFNGHLLVDSQQLGKKPHVFHLKITETDTENRLLIYAENLGRYPPNTCFVTIEAGKGKKHRIKMQPNYDKSDAIYLRYEPEK